MQTNILWTGREYYSLENCLINVTNSGTEVLSTIVGMYHDHLYHVEYLIKTNTAWETVFFELKSRYANKIQKFQFEADGKGNWMTHGKRADQFKGCIDIDIPLTPFTNTLPINRLKLSTQDEQQILVLYIDVLEQQIRPVHQKYSKLSTTKYHYENVPNDFEAEIEVDEAGIVVDYPSLFVRTAVLESNYVNFNN